MRTDFKNRSADKDVQDLMARYEWAYGYVTAHWSRMEEAQAMYDNQIDLSSWPTLSEIPIPMLWMAVWNALGPAMDYLMPNNKFTEAYSRAGYLDAETLDRISEKMHYTIMRKMRLRRNGLKTIKDCFKFGIGYGAVEPVVITPEASVIQRFFLPGGRMIRQDRLMKPGLPVLSESYQYLSPGQIVPTPDGDRPESVSAVHRVDLVTEEEFKQLYDTQKDLYGKAIYSGDPVEIIKEARSLNFSASLRLGQYMAILGGRDVNITNKGDQRYPIRVPVMKIYEKNRHVWIANGTTKIFDQKNTFQTMRCPVVVASAWPDGDRWFVIGAAEASRGLQYGVNVFTNAIMDLAGRILNPQPIVNKQMTGPAGKLPTDRFAPIEVSGDVRQAFAYAQNPEMNQNIFEVGNMLNQWNGAVNAQPAFMQGQGSAGVVRGGAGAFETLLSTPLGREKLAATILETDWMEDTVDRAVILSQLLIPEDGEEFPVDRWDPATGKRYQEMVSIMPEDLRHSIKVELSLQAKMRNSMSEFAIRAGVFDRVVGRMPQYANLRGAVDYLSMDDRVSRQVLLPDDEVNKRQQEDRAAALKERELGIAKAEAQGQPPAGTSANELAAAGATGAGQ